MENLILDLYPAYIPFVVQCTEADGDVVNPTVDNLIIYEEGGADATFDSTTITGSPFDPVQVNAKTGLWGVLVAKSVFTAGKFYIALWEMTVDTKTTAKVERYFACNSSQFKATGYSTLTAADVNSEVDNALDTAIPASPTSLSINDYVKNKLTKLGVGAISWTYTLTRSDNGQPIGDADVWVTSDIGGSNVVDSGRTNQNGVVTFNLDAGVVYLWRQKSGFSFSNPDTETVS